MNWQPIETAPKNGTFVFGVCVGKNKMTNHPYLPFVMQWAKFPFESDGIGWRGADGYGYECNKRYTPTHWAPIAYPEASEKSPPCLKCGYENEGDGHVCPPPSVNAEGVRQ